MAVHTSSQATVRDSDSLRSTSIDTAQFYVQFGWPDRRSYNWCCHGVMLVFCGVTMVWCRYGSDVVEVWCWCRCGVGVVLMLVSMYWCVGEVVSMWCWCSVSVMLIWCGVGVVWWCGVAVVLLWC